MEWHTEKRQLSELKEWKGNPRTITKEAYKRLVESIKTRGFHDIIKIDQDNIVLSGNQRLKALKEIGFTEVECKVADRDLTPEEKEDIAIESNHSDGEWDMDKLANEYEEALNRLGFDELLPEKVIEVEEDDYEEPEELPIRVKTGEIWQLGNHRLMCGDSTKIEDVERLMDGQKADMVFTDPPYELETQGGGVFQNSRQMNEVRDNGVDSFDPSVLIPFAKTSIYFHNKPLIKKYCQLAEDWGVSYDLAIYKKQGLPNWKGHLMTDVEYIAILGELDPNKGLEMGMYSKVYEGKKDADNKLSYSKPIELCSKFIQLYSTNSVLDLFGGSGSTLIACEQTNRVCYMMELDEHYCTVILDRWEKLTGKQGIKIE